MFNITFSFYTHRKAVHYIKIITKLIIINTIIVLYLWVIKSNLIELILIRLKLIKVQLYRPMCNLKHHIVVLKKYILNNSNFLSVCMLHVIISEVW